MTADHARRSEIVRRTIVTGALGGAGTGLVMLVLTGLLLRDLGLLDFDEMLPQLWQTSFFSIVLGLLAGVVAALPVAAVMALAVRWLAVRRVRAQLVCASACAVAAVVLTGVIIMLVAGTAPWEWFAAHPAPWVPVVAAAGLGSWRGPYLVAGRSAAGSAAPGRSPGA
ncbi:hypothetical protein [Planomonospora venezuelensis]|uniref:Uncharacterized protein n=1 Tax=Planomonospora venezuelensis TaxID=1999 RepID=A0A841CZU2_PLAVE|nr:hypothetical protein [Planomonospora venezuelensis]MBB5962990.1 hypothetical protein [Planomonospora venezuelensis]GIN00558.1 hypothetical protein Pve01_22160 [Planomonospora venezuelensis]